MDRPQTLRRPDASLLLGAIFFWLCIESGIGCTGTPSPPLPGAAPASTPPRAAEFVEPPLLEPIPPITAATVAPHLHALIAGGPRPAHDEERNAVVIGILTRLLEGWGYTVREESFFAEVYAPSEGSLGSRWEKREGKLVNLLAERAGSRWPTQIVEVCAHYDTIPYVIGADDNTSGVAGALEVARVLAEIPLEKTIRFCFFAGEEEGLLGSKFHVEQLLEAGVETVDALINLEMIGYTARGPDSQRAPPGIDTLIGVPEEGTFIAILGSALTADLGDLVVASFRSIPELEVFGMPRLGSWFPDSYRSDHGAYWSARLPAVMVTDTADYRNPHYHGHGDTLDTLDLPFLARVASGVAEAVRRRAGPAGRPPKSP